jgi:hypothetical protein
VAGFYIITVNNSVNYVVFLGRLAFALSSWGGGEDILFGFVHGYKALRRITGNVQLPSGVRLLISQYMRFDISLLCSQNGGLISFTFI